MSSTAGNCPPGKISVPMNCMNFRSEMVSLMALSRKNVWVCARMVCNSILPSAGRMLYARSKNRGYRSALKASNAPIETIRSTGSSNSSQPCSLTSAVRSVGIDAISALLYYIGCGST
jgi:hypothetical protein